MIFWESIAVKSAKVGRNWVSYNLEPTEIIDPELTIDRALETYFKGRVLTGVDEPKTSGNSGKKRAYRRLAGSWNKRRHGISHTYQRDFHSLVRDDHKRI